MIELVLALELFFGSSRSSPKQIESQNLRPLSTTNLPWQHTLGAEYFISPYVIISLYMMRVDVVCVLSLVATLSLSEADGARTKHELISGREHHLLLPRRPMCMHLTCLVEKRNMKPVRDFYWNISELPISPYKFMFLDWTGRCMQLNMVSEPEVSSSNPG
jgi:hypothetical protein